LYRNVNIEDIDQMVKAISRAQTPRQAGNSIRRDRSPPEHKAAISLRVDQDVLDWFKSRGRGYQTRINAVLRAFRDASL
jgi:uncharacterized protein (DUF4415 family)